MASKKAPVKKVTTKKTTKAPAKKAASKVTSVESKPEPTEEPLPKRKYLRSFQVIPPGGWRYYNEETKETITAPTFEMLIRRVNYHRQHRQVPLKTAADIEEQIAGNIPDHETSWIQFRPRSSF